MFQQGNRSLRAAARNHMQHDTQTLNTATQDTAAQVTIIQRAKAWRQPVGHALDAGVDALRRGGGRLWCTLANGWRRLRHKQLPDYVVIALDHEITERAPHVSWWHAYLPWIKLPLSLEYLYPALERIAGDPDVRGVVFLVKGPTVSLPKAQSVNQLFARFRTWDAAHRPTLAAPPKQIIVHLEDAGAAALVLAAPADKIVMTPLSSWSFAGLRVAPLYLKDALARIGVAMDVAQISPWKTALDTFQHSHMSPEARDQYNWLLDSLFDDIVSALAQGRNLPPAQVRAHIDRAPLLAPDALAAGLIDALLYEDELPAWLAQTDPVGTSDQSNDADKPGKPARLTRYAQARGLLFRRPRPRHARAVGVLTLEGAIVSGNSRRFPIPLPLVGDKLMGSRTVAHQVRAARKNRRLAAVVLHVDSGGGSVLASDLIWRELDLLAQEKPLIVYMGDVAASGGYYIATPGRKIVAQRTTLTGSIGVVIAKPVTGAATAKLGAKREVVQRGANAGLNADDNPWTPEERAKIFEGVHHVYEVFKARVSAGRGLPLDELDAIANGRVWTGSQARAHGLVDEVGDFWTAVELACAEANLPADGSVSTLNLAPTRASDLAQPAQGTAMRLGKTDLAAWTPLVRALLAGEWEALVGRDRYWLWADGLPRLRD